MHIKVSETCKNKQNLQFFRYFYFVREPCTTYTSSRLDYDPFGMLTVGRTWVAGSQYRYSFNGMEHDDETAGNDVAVDFGARIYDGRLGRWLSVDKKQNLQPSWSPYKAFKNSPICIIDPDGRTEYMVTEIRDESTGKSFFLIEVVDADKVISDVTSELGTIDPHDTHKVMGYYDIVHHKTVTIGASGVKVDYPNDSYGLNYTRSYFKLFRALGTIWRKDLGGDGGVQSGGVMFTSEKGGIDPTKFIASHTVSILNVDDFLQPMQALISSMGMMNWGTEPPDLNDVEAQVELVNYAKKIAEQFISANSDVDVTVVKQWLNGLPSCETIEICSYCYENSGKQVIAEDHNQEMWPVPVEWYNEHKSKLEESSPNTKPNDK